MSGEHWPAGMEPTPTGGADPTEPGGPDMRAIVDSIPRDGSVAMGGRTEYARQFPDGQAVEDEWRSHA